MCVWSCCDSFPAPHCLTSEHPNYYIHVQDIYLQSNGKSTIRFDHHVPTYIYALIIMFLYILYIINIYIYILYIINIYIYIIYRCSFWLVIDRPWSWFSTVLWGLLCRSWRLFAVQGSECLGRRVHCSRQTQTRTTGTAELDHPLICAFDFRVERVKAVKKPRNLTQNWDPWMVGILSMI